MRITGARRYLHISYRNICSHKEHMLIVERQLEDARLVSVCRSSTDPNAGLGPHEDGASLECYQAMRGVGEPGFC